MNETTVHLLPSRFTKYVGGLLLSSLAAAVGCSDNPPPPAKAFTFIETAGTGGSCKAPSGPWLVIGSEFGTGDAGPQSIEDGETSPDDGSRINVSCRVARDGDGFSVQAEVTKARAGTMGIVGFLRDTPEPQDKIRGSFIPKDTGQFKDSNCSVKLVGIAAGRVWGEINCPAATNDSQQVCNIHGKFKFENCSM